MPFLFQVMHFAIGAWYDLVIVVVAMTVSYLFRYNQATHTCPTVVEHLQDRMGRARPRRPCFFFLSFDNLFNFNHPTHISQ